MVELEKRKTQTDISLILSEPMLETLKNFLKYIFLILFFLLPAYTFAITPNQCKKDNACLFINNDNPTKITKFKNVDIYHVCIDGDVWVLGMSSHNDYSHRTLQPDTQYRTCVEIKEIKEKKNDS